MEFVNFKEKLVKLQKITSDDFIQTASNPHSESQAIAKDILLEWENEISVEQIETEIFGLLSPLIALLYNYSGKDQKQVTLSRKPTKVYFEPQQKDSKKEESFPKT